MPRVTIMDDRYALKPFPYAIPAIALALLAIGWAGLARAEELVEGSGRVLRQQIVWSVLGVGLMMLAAFIGDYRRLARWSILCYIGMIASLVAVYAFAPVNGARRWIRLAGVGVQPSEFAKLAYLVVMASYLANRDVAGRFVATAVPLLLTIVPMLLVLKEPDLGTSIVFVPLLLAMLFVAGARSHHLLRLVLAGVLLVPLLWSQMSREQRSRITSLAEQNGPREAATVDGFHLDQAKRMFAGGGWFGTLVTSGDDDLPAARVPEPHTDSIFCVIGERFGLVGAAMVLALFAALIGRLIVVATRCDEPFGQLIVVGITTLFATEVVINTGMMAGLLPITGLSLPFLSYGGSGLLAHMLSLGLAINVARHTPPRIW